MQLLIESLTPELTDYVEDFIDFMCGTLGVEDRPEVSFVAQTGNASFGSYQPSDGSVVVATQGRHIADTLRTLGHEIVHHKQMESGELESLSLLELERDANAVVGLAMRDYNQLHPEMYGVIDGPGTAENKLKTRYASINEEMAVNSAGSGGVAGIGVGPKGEPGIQKKARTKMLTRLMPKKMLGQVVAEAHEMVLWGLPKGKTDRLHEIVLSTQCKTQAELDKIKARASKDGWHGFRVTHLDLSKTPDFTNTINEAIESGPGELRVDEDGPVVSRTKFAGQDVFQVPSEYFHKARLGKAKYAHYRHYVGTDDVGQSIRDFGNRNYGKPIIVQDAATQHMIYLRYGKGR